MMTEILWHRRETRRKTENRASQTHLSLAIDTLAGTWAAESITYYSNTGTGFEQIDSGTAKGMKCPAVTADELEADKKFAEAVKKLDRK